MKKRDKELLTYLTLSAVGIIAWISALVWFFSR